VKDFQQPFFSVIFHDSWQASKRTCARVSATDAHRCEAMPRGLAGARVGIMMHALLWYKKPPTYYKYTPRIGFTLKVPDGKWIRRTSLEVPWELFRGKNPYLTDP
jgi:hypothetical protein